MNHTVRMLRLPLAAALLAACAAAASAQDEGPLASLQAAYLRTVVPGEQAELHRELLATVLDRIRRSHASEVDLGAFTAAALQAMEPLPAGAGVPAEVFRKAVNEALRTLDPHSRYIDPKTLEADRAEGSGSGGFGGLGLEVEAGEGTVRVVAPIPDSPAARAGLQRGDLILQVDDQPLAGVPLPEAIARLRGQPGTAVSLTIRRAGAEEFTVALTRDVIRRQAVRWNFEGDTLVLTLKTFSAPVGLGVEQAVAQAVAQAGAAKADVRGIVLDMRGNGGGLLNEAVKVADAFLAGGDIVSLKGRTPANQRRWQADAKELLPGVPMVVLIDDGSASATELVAAALQEHGRAVVMGRRSYGKGSVQTTYPLGEHKGALKLTTAVYLGPSGRSVQRIGVAPDIELVPPVAPESTRSEASRAQALPAADSAGEPRMRVEQAHCAAGVLKTPDPMLACAMAYLRTPSLPGFSAALTGRD